jgi:hypothetical protein
VRESESKQEEKQFWCNQLSPGRLAFPEIENPGKIGKVGILFSLDEVS